jgi:membrane-associated phospholipid phosphatase
MNLYSIDAADNLFPSIHCLESWVCFRGIMLVKDKSKIYTPIVLIFTLLVFASTVCLKQHVVADIVGGVLVSEIGFAVATMIFRKVPVHE